jgi:ribonucleoside-diphosphate reductase alpha chain
MDLAGQLLSDITVHSKYSRFIPELKRRETWNEIVGRNVAMHMKKYPHMREEIFDAYKLVYDKKILPSMRSLQFAGKPIEISPNRLYNCCYAPIDDWFVFAEIMFLLLGGSGVGYALALNTPIPTPDGWRDMSNLEVGDLVLGDDGKPTKIVDVSPIYYKHNCYTVEFSNGQEIIADENHLWTVQIRGQRNTNGYHTGKNKSTKKTIELEKGDSIDVTHAIELPEKELVLDPYILGYWLGDGNRSNSVISTGDKFITEEFDRLGFKTTHLRRYEYYVKNGLGKKLKQLGLQKRWTNPDTKKRLSIGFKRIPVEYLRASFSQRMSLLQGLMDSDGTCTKKGQCVFSVIDKDLAEDTLELCCSLGLNPTLTTRKCRDVQLWTVSFTTETPVFRLPRKLERLCSHTKQSDRIFVRNIRVVDSVPVKCITVDNESHLYLAGKMFVPTHNSVQKHHVDKLPRLQKPIDRKRRHLIADSIEGWAEAIKTLMKAYFFGLSDPVFDFSDIRPKGAPLVTSGGRAPGSQPLKDCIHSIKSILNAKEINSKLTPIECHDILCHIADAVLSGGIRRSAMIALFSLDDIEMLTCKYGSWWTENKQRARANNSAVILRHRIKKKEFLAFWKTIKLSGCGEPGFVLSNNMEMGFNPCVEASLKALTFCNLATINASNIESQEDLNERARMAARIATCQAGFTDFHFIRDEWKRATEKDALIGVSMTGVASGKVLELNLEEAARIVVEENIRVAKLLGINPAARTTCMKPEGTSSCVLGGVSSGIHDWHDFFFIRRQTFNKEEPIYPYLLSKFPDLMEDSFEKPHLEAKFSIPLKAPKGATIRDGALSLLKRVKKISDEWVQPGHISGDNSHNVSATISLREDEWEEVGEWMWRNRESYNGLSVLPFDGTEYVQMPFESCSKYMHDKLSDYLTSVDLSDIIEGEDNTKQKEILACTNGQCEI